MVKKSKATLTIIIIEDDKGFLKNLLVAMESEPINVIEVCTSIEEAIECFSTIKKTPDVILASLEMLRKAAAINLHYIREKKSVVAASRVIIIGDRCAVDGRMSLSREGASGFILRAEPIAKIVKCIKVVAGGEVWMDAQIVNNVFREYVDFYSGSGERINQPTPNHHERLKIMTTREKEILELLSMSLTNEEIARGLFISIDTVKTHVRNIFEKLGVKNRVEAVLIFIGASIKDSAISDYLKSS